MKYPHGILRLGEGSNWGNPTGIISVFGRKGSREAPGFDKDVVTRAWLVACEAAKRTFGAGCRGPG